jgi:hypothetical protein
MPRSTKTLEILMTRCDSCSASVARLLLMMSTCTLPCPASLTSPAYQWDVGHTPAPLLVSPVAPPGLSPVGKEEFGGPPMSGRAR